MILPSLTRAETSRGLHQPWRAPPFSAQGPSSFGAGPERSRQRLRRSRAIPDRPKRSTKDGRYIQVLNDLLNLSAGP